MCAVCRVQCRDCRALLTSVATPRRWRRYEDDGASTEYLEGGTAFLNTTLSLTVAAAGPSVPGLPCPHPSGPCLAVDVSAVGQHRGLPSARAVELKAHNVAQSLGTPSAVFAAAASGAPVVKLSQVAACGATTGSGASTWSASDAGRVTVCLAPQAPTAHQRVFVQYARAA